MHCGWSSPQIPTSILCVDLLTNQIGWKAGLCKGQTNYCNRIPRTHTTDIFINRKDKLKKKDNKCLPSWNTSNKCEEEKKILGNMTGVWTDSEDRVRDGRRDEGPAEEKVLHSALREMETGGRLGWWWLTDVQGRRRLKPSHEGHLRQHTKGQLRGGDKTKQVRETENEKKEQIIVGGYVR